MDIIEEIEALLTGAPSEHWIEPFSRAADTIERLTRELAEANRIREETLAESMRQGAALRAEVEEAKAQREALMDALTDAMRIVAKADPKGFADWIASAGREAG